MQELDADIDGRSTFADFGGEGPVMLLVHGLVGAHLNWMAVAPQLAAHNRVFALDLPGFGSVPARGAAFDDRRPMSTSWTSFESPGFSREPIGAHG